MIRSRMFILAGFAFTVAVVINLALLGQDESTRMQVAYLPLLPLAFLLFTGLYLFALPYLAKWRGDRTPTER